MFFFSKSDGFAVKKNGVAESAFSCFVFSQVDNLDNDQVSNMFGFWNVFLIIPYPK